MFKNIYKYLVVFQLVFGSTTVMAATYNFAEIHPDNNALLTSLGNQLTLNVTSSDLNTVDFTLTNPATTAMTGISSSIIAAYFGTFGNAANPFGNTLVKLSQSAGVIMPENGATPGSLQNGGSVNFTTVYGIDSEGNANTRVANGINANDESLVIRGTTALSFASILSAIDNGSFGIGLLVRDLSSQNGGTDTYLNLVPAPSAVPLPAAGWLFGSALIGLMGLRRKMH